MGRKMATYGYNDQVDNDENYGAHENAHTLMVLRNATYWRSKRVEWIEKSGGAQIVLYRGGSGFPAPRAEQQCVAFPRWCRMDARSAKRGWPCWNDLCIPERCRTWDAWWQVWVGTDGGEENWDHGFSSAPPGYEDIF